MPGWMWGLIAALLVIDVAVTLWVVQRIRRRRQADGASGGDPRSADIDRRPIQ